MTTEQPKKKSRIGLAILFLSFLIGAFLVAAVGLSLVLRWDRTDSSLGSLLESGNKIGVIEIEETILSADKVLKRMRKLRKKSSIKAILIRIDSPGGAVGPAQEIYREIEKTKKSKPVVASIQTIGTSAAYYIACNADRVVCSNGTITGSIGVIMMMTEIHKVIDKLGVDVKVIKAGKYKDIGSAVRPMTDEERQLLENFAKELHEQFIKDVASARKEKINIDKLREVADGSFFTGQRAKELGLVDSIGNLYDAVEIAKELAGIKGEVELLYPEKKWGTYLDMFLSETSIAITKALERSRLLQPAPIIK